MKAFKLGWWTLGILLLALVRVEALDPDPHGIMVQPIPDKLVVLTFDDACVSHATYVGPLLKKYGFGGTFYITEFAQTFADKTLYMSWEQIKGLEAMGFEVGNHSLRHGYFGSSSVEECARQLRGIEEHCLAAQVAKPVTFCWPVYSVNKRFFATLSGEGYLFARGGHERPYRPTLDGPFDVPSFTVHDKSLERKDSFAAAAEQATDGRAVVFCFHGVPDLEHPTVGVEPKRFEELMSYLKEHQYKVISMRDLAKYVDAKKAAKFLPFPSNLPWGGVTAEGNRLYFSVRNLPADRRLSVPGMTSPIAKAWMMGDAKKQALTVVKADSGVDTIIVPESADVLRSGFPTVIVAEIQGGPVATILDWVFPGAPEGTIRGEEILAPVAASTDRKHLRPIYRTGSPLVTGQPGSGVERDFTQPQTYTVRNPEGRERSYRVTAVPTLGAVKLANSSFERFEGGVAPSLTKDGRVVLMGWSFILGKSQGEMGVRDLMEEPSAPPPRDGSRHAVYLRGAGNGIAQQLIFDPGSYTIRFDAVKRGGYEKVAAPLVVTIDGEAIFTVKSSEIIEKWGRYQSPPFKVSAGLHRFGVVLGEGDGMDLIDDLVLEFRK